MSAWVQSPLFDTAMYRLRPSRKTRADNAAKRRRGRLVVAGSLVFDDEGRILLLHRSTHSSTWWETPGGKIDGTESPREAVHRELREELGIQVEITDDLGWHDFFTDEMPMRYALYRARISDGSPVPREDKFDDVRFFTWEQVFGMTRELSPNAKRIAERYREGLLLLAPA